MMMMIMIIQNLIIIIIISINTELYDCAESNKTSSSAPNSCLSVLGKKAN